MNGLMKKVLLLFLFVGFCVPSAVMAQYSYGTTGLLHAPTADMQRDKTFMLGGGHINKWSTTKNFQKLGKNYTLNYYLNITIFPWLEVGYTCTLVYAQEGSTRFPESVWGTFCNQDRSFNVRLRVWKEGWWKAWTPQIVIGSDDVTTHNHYGGSGFSSGGESGNNNYLTRYYIAATKHFDFKNIGNLGAHISFIIGNAMNEPHYKRPAAGVNFQFDVKDEHFWGKALNGLNLMAEYYPIRYTGEEGETTGGVNIGASYKLWRDHINLWCEQYDMDHFSWGVAFKVHLK